jgi:hypothetical protein
VEPGAGALPVPGGFLRDRCWEHADSVSAFPRRPAPRPCPRPRPCLEHRLLALLSGFVTDLIAQYGYLAIFVLMVLEGRVPIPSEVTMLFGSRS